MAAAAGPRLVDGLSTTPHNAGAPLLGAAESLAAVRSRFAGFGAVDARDMNAVYGALVLGHEDEFRRIAALEIFDDPDQFNLIMSHYCFVLAGGGVCGGLVAGVGGML